MVDPRPAIVSLHTTVRVSDGAALAAATFETPAPILRALLRNDGPSVRPWNLHDIFTAHREPDDVPLPRPRSLTRVVEGRWVPGELREALTRRPAPLVDEERAR